MNRSGWVVVVVVADFYDLPGGPGLSRKASLWVHDRSVSPPIPEAALAASGGEVDGIDVYSLRDRFGRLQLSRLNRSGSTAELAEERDFTVRYFFFMTQYCIHKLNVFCADP